ncbi:MAG: response regulator [Proteobacteria bacterium]|nr:MAG: response regulator [Pseudomonadota bacterium]
MVDKPATRQRGVSHDRDASTIVIYLLLAFAIDFLIYRTQSEATPFPWLVSQAFGLALIVTLGMRFWFVIFVSVFTNGYFIWHEGRSVSVMFLGIIMTGSYVGAAFLWHKLRASSYNTLGKTALFTGLSLLVTGIVSRLSWSVLMRYELIDPIPARIWASQLTLRDFTDFLASFPFYTLVFFPFLDSALSRTASEKRHISNWIDLARDAGFALIPFAALALPKLDASYFPYLYLLFLPAFFAVYHFRLRGAIAFTFAIHLWLYEAWPFNDAGTVNSNVIFFLTLLASSLGVAYLWDRDYLKNKDVLAKKNEEISSAHTQLVELEENRREWRQLTQTLERLVVRSTQDLRTPLTPIYMWSQMLKEDGSKQAIQDASDGIQTSIERQTKMLEELRDSVRISMGHQTIRQDTFDLADLLSELSVGWKDESQTKLLEFRYERPLKSSLISGDREQLSLALKKLFEHLIQFGKDHAVISLHATTQHRDVVLHLKHSGYSSDQHHVLKLLQAGQGMDAESFLTAANFDLALYTAKKLIDLQGGRLTAASLNPKPGMLFSLSLKRPSRDAKVSPLPLVQAPPVPLPRAMGPFASDANQKQTMLIVEDDPFTLHLLDSLLTGEGIEIIACSNSTDAIEAFHREQPTLVLADLGLPDINGFELVRRLKRGARHDFIAVAFSAAVTQEAQAQALEAGFSAFLAKPLQAKELLETMQQLQAAHHPRPFPGVDLTLN